MLGILILQQLAEQCEVTRDASGTSTIQVKAASEIPCESLPHPTDPDSSYNAHQGQGYAVQIMETYAEDDQGRRGHTNRSATARFDYARGRA
jgi:hypothetical protein